MDLSVFFLRNGIRDNVAQYAQKDIIERLNAFEPAQPVRVVEPPGMRNMFFSMATAQERDRLRARTAQIKAMMGTLEGPKKEEVLKSLMKYEEALKILDAKTKELEQIKENEETQPKPSHDYGSKIGELAAKIGQDYFDNTEFWA